MYKNRKRIEFRKRKKREIKPSNLFKVIIIRFFNFLSKVITLTGNPKTVLLPILCRYITQMLRKYDPRTFKQNKYPSREELKKSSIIGIMLKRQIGKTLVVAAILIFGCFVYIVFLIAAKRTEVSILGPIAIIFSLIGIILIRELIFIFRIRNGLYGTNEREAREIINFIIQNSENINFTDKGQPKKIISAEDLKEVETSIEAVLKLA